jgi:hypothetical protein
MHNQGNLWASLKLAQAHFQRGSAHLKVLRQLPKRHFLSEPTKLPSVDFLPFPLHTVISTNSDAPWFDQLRAASTIKKSDFTERWKRIFYLWALMVGEERNIALAVNGSTAFTRRH